MLDKHFPKKSKLHKIFNRSTVKVSYSTMPNVERIIKNHNNRLTNEKDGPDQRREEDRKDRNCRNKQDCPMDGNCLTESIVYQAVVKNNRSDNTKTYIGLTEGTFTQRGRSSQTLPELSDYGETTRSTQNTHDLY